MGEAFRAVFSSGGHRVLEEVPLADVINVEAISRYFEEADLTALRQQRFDLVLFGPDGEPLVALEFDGPCHEREPKRRADARKNRACWAAGLPLRRFGAMDVQPHDKHALVDWVAARYRAWTEGNRTEGTWLDFEDPRFWFDLLAPFPGCRRKAEHLWRTYGILSEQLDDALHEEAVSVAHGSVFLELQYAGGFSGPKGEYTRWFLLRRELRRCCYVPGAQSNELLKTFERSTHYQWCLPLSHGERSRFRRRRIFDARIHKASFLSHEVMGMDPEELAHGLMDYLLLSDVAKWAALHLRPGTKQTGP